MKTAPMIAYHAKNDRQGWHEIARHPADWTGWGKFDRSMIEEMMRHGHITITCGWNMYQLVRAE
jgi:hypothetical protein